MLSGHFLPQLQRLRKKMDSLLSTRETAQDSLAELEVAAALAASGFNVSIEEPDLVVRGIVSFPKLGIPVKRPRNVKSAARSLHEAIRQSRAAGLPSVAILSLDAVVRGQSDGTPWEFWSRTRKGLQDGNWQRFREFVRSIEGLVRFRTDSNMVGVIYLARVPGSVVPHPDIGARPAYARDSFVLLSLNRDHWESGEGAMTQLVHALRKGLSG